MNYNQTGQNMGSVMDTSNKKMFVSPYILSIDITAGNFPTITLDMEYVDLSLKTISTKQDTTFSEFIAVEQIESPDVQLESTPSHSQETLSISDNMTRETIVDLRIKLNEGTDASEFSDTFPYEKK